MASIRLPIIVLHTRPYRETSLIIEGFSAEHGRIPLIAKGARSQSKNQLRSSLQMSAVIEGSISGRGELRHLTNVEQLKAPHIFIGEAFAMAAYVSELTLKLTQPWDPLPEFYSVIIDTFQNLESTDKRVSALRRFEFCLIQSLGIVPDFEYDVTGHAIEKTIFYNFVSEQGFVPVNGKSAESIPGKVLAEITSENEFSDDTLKILKTLNRKVLQPHLDGRPLKSRELWLQWRSRQG